MINQNSKIVIIGAGLAGLTAAYYLQQLVEHSIEIYEARTRPGGRVFSVRIGDSYDDLGGKSLRDGGNGKNILALVDKLGLTTESYRIHYNQYYIYRNEIFSPALLLKNFLPPPDQIPALCARYIKTMNSLGEIFDDLFEEKKLLRTFMELWSTNFDGSSSYALSSEYITFYLRMANQISQADENAKTLDADFCTVKRGNSRLIEALIKTLNIPIHYGSPLRRIEKLPTQKYCLHFDNHHKVIADYLILALPCSTLRNVHLDANVLYSDQLQAIQTLQYGTNGKILLPTHLNQPPHDLILTENVSSWFNQKASILTLYYGGANGIFGPEQIPSMILNEWPALKMYYRKLELPLELIPAIPTEDLNAHYTQPVGMSWIQEEFSKGSYSNYGVGQYDFFNETLSEYGETVKKVFRCVDGKIFFAGEHADLIDIGTLEGAVNSGARAARSLAHALNSS